MKALLALALLAPGLALAAPTPKPSRYAPISVQVVRSKVTHPNGGYMSYPTKVCDLQSAAPVFDLTTPEFDKGYSSGEPATVECEVEINGGLVKVKVDAGIQIHKYARTKGKQKRAYATLTVTPVNASTWEYQRFTSVVSTRTMSEPSLMTEMWSHPKADVTHVDHDYVSAYIEFNDVNQ